MNKLMLFMAMAVSLTACACSKETKREKVLAKALKETNLRYDYARDQNERYSRQLKKLTQERKRK